MTFTRRSSRLLAGLGIAGTTVLLVAGPAAADTSQARAKAAKVTLLGGSIVDTGQVVATNNGTTQTKTGTGSTSVLGGQTLLTAGVFAQDAVARNDGTSAACAGAVGSGGVIQVGAAGPCVPTIGTPAGVTLNLGTGLATLRADAIFAQCTASSTGAPTGSATLANAQVFVLGNTPITLAGAPAPNQGANVPPLANIVLNEQITNPDGSLTVNALHVTLLPAVPGPPLAEVIVGSVTCGPNIPTGIGDLFAGPALPVSAAGAVVIGGVFFFRRRRQLAA